MTSESVIGSSTQADSSATSGSMPPPLNVIIPTQGEQQGAGGQQTPQTETPTQLGTVEGAIQNTRVRRPSRPPSNAWLYFTRENDKAKCSFCSKVYACNSSKNGTSNMNKHLLKCVKNPNREANKKQKTIALGKDSEDDPNSTVSFKLVEFSQELTRLALAKMIIMDELAFRHVENEGFRYFVSVACPRFKIPCRISVAKDLYPFRSCLNSNTVEALICTQNWIRKPKVIDLRQQMDEVQQLEEEIAGIRLTSGEVNIEGMTT